MLRSLVLLKLPNTHSRALSKVCKSSVEALDGLKDGSSVLFAGFGPCGVAENLIRAIKEKNIKHLTVISNDIGIYDYGPIQLLENNQIDKLYCSYIGHYQSFANMFNNGGLEVHLTPQGTLAEKLRSGGAGIPAFYTPTGVGTVVETGGFPVKFNPDHTVAKYSEPKESRVFNGRKHLLEESITGEFACVKAWKADTSGNLVFRGTARNFNPEIAKAAKIAIAEVEHIVETGELHPDEIHLPGIYIDRVVLGERYEKRIEKRTVRHNHDHSQHALDTHKLNHREIIAHRAAQEFREGMYVNLGIGLPTLACNYIPQGMNVVLHAENGLLGTGPFPLAGSEDADFINAGKETISCAPGASTFSSSESFAMVRGRCIDLTILGAMEVSAAGDLASWIIPGQTVKGMGGAMDLVASCDKIVVTTTHTDKKGRPKIVEQCSLPITGRAAADMIITELAVFHVDRKNGGGLTLLEHSPAVTIEELRKVTGAPFIVSPDVKHMHI